MRDTGQMERPRLLSSYEAGQAPLEDAWLPGCDSALEAGTDVESYGASDGRVRCLTKVPTGHIGTDEFQIGAVE